MARRTEQAALRRFFASSLRFLMRPALDDAHGMPASVVARYVRGTYLVTATTLCGRGRRVAIWLFYEVTWQPAGRNLKGLENRPDRAFRTPG